MQYFANSDRGRRRSHNEDRYLLLPFEGGLLAAVFDGMGGHADGDLAAELACEVFRESFSATPPHTPKEGAALLVNAAKEADSAIRACAALRRERAGMGTTVTALLLIGDSSLILNVGDSRIYLLREGDLILLTHDDSFVQELVDAGRLDPVDAAFHPYRNVITRSLGNLGGGELEIPLGVLHRGDSYLLCSDGLYDMMSEGAIKRLLAQQLAPSSTVGYLIAGANERGGEDNITAALVRV